MAHVVLSTPPRAAAVSAPGRYADTAVPALLQAMSRKGARPERIRARLVGGAAVLRIEGGGLPKIGERTAQAVRVALLEAGVPVCAEATGGTVGRTARMDAESGQVFVRELGSQEVQL